MSDTTGPHAVRVALKAFGSRDNRIFIDGKEIKGVTRFAIDAAVGKAGRVSITFFADVAGEFTGAVGNVNVLGEDAPEEGEQAADA